MDPEVERVVSVDEDAEEEACRQEPENAIREISKHVIIID